MKLFIKILVLIVVIAIFVLISALIAENSLYNFVFIFSTGYISYPIINREKKIKYIKESIYENRKD